jgi:hypothetical protein
MVVVVVRDYGDKEAGVGLLVNGELTGWTRDAKGGWVISNATVIAWKLPSLLPGGTWHPGSFGCLLVPGHGDAVAY